MFALGEHGMSGFDVCGSINDQGYAVFFCAFRECVQLVLRRIVKMRVYIDPHWRNLVYQRCYPIFRRRSLSCSCS